MVTVDSPRRTVDNNVATVWTCNLSIPSLTSTLCAVGVSSGLAGSGSSMECMIYAQRNRGRKGSSGGGRELAGNE